MRRDTLLAPSLQLLRKGLKKALNAMETLHVKKKKKNPLGHARGPYFRILMS